jgi:hypothetical protein
LKDKGGGVAYHLCIITCVYFASTNPRKRDKSLMYISSIMFREKREMAEAVEYSRVHSYR